MPSRRARIAAEQSPLSRAIARARREGTELVDLTASNPTEVGFPTPEHALRLLSDTRAGIYAPEPFGLRAAREAISTMEGVPMDHVVLAASTSEAYTHLLTLFCDPGDCVLVPRPSYPLLEVLARYAGVETVPYDLAYDGEWHVDVSTLRADAKLVLAVSPNNPTGSYLSAQDLEALLALGVPLVLDEVFAAYPLEGSPAPRDTRGLVISLGGLSKQAAMPQLKLAWMTFRGEDARVREALDALEHLADAFLSVATPVQLALPGLLAQGEATRARILRRLRANLAALDGALAGTVVSRLRVEAGFYAVLRLPDVASEDDFAIAALEAGVLVQPGYLYDFLERPRLVISLLAPEEELSRGVRALLGVVARFVA